VSEEKEINFEWCCFKDMIKKKGHPGGTKPYRKMNAIPVGGTDSHTLEINL
jgi:hypothetical protein